MARTCAAMTSVLLVAVLASQALAQYDYPPEEPSPPPKGPYGPCDTLDLSPELEGVLGQSVVCDSYGPKTAIAKLLEQLNSPQTAQPQTSYAVCDPMILPTACRNSTVGCKYALQNCGSGTGKVLVQRASPGLYRYFMDLTLSVYMDTPAASPRKLGDTTKPTRLVVALIDYRAEINCGGIYFANNGTQSFDERQIDCSIFDPMYGNFYTGGVQCCEKRL